MREDDRNEIAATSGREPVDVLLDGIASSVECYTAILDNEVFCMFGVVDTGSGFLCPRVGVAWLLTSTLVDSNKILFWKACRECLSWLFDRWDVLINAIDCRHKTALRWAARLGFELGDPVAFGVLGLPFRQFRVTRESLNV
jgi:hypothetical protein